MGPSAAWFYKGQLRPQRNDMHVALGGLVWRLAFISQHSEDMSYSAFFWAHLVQTSDDGVLVTARSCFTVFIRRPSSLGGYPIAATSAVRVFAAARRAAHSSSDYWRPSMCCCRSDTLEQSATRHY